MHAVRQGSSSTTKICANFDGFMKTSTGISLIDSVMVGFIPDRSSNSIMNALISTSGQHYQHVLSHEVTSI